MSDHPTVPIHGFHNYHWTGGSILHDRIVLSAAEEVLADWFRWRSFLGDVFDARQRSGALGGWRGPDFVIAQFSVSSEKLRAAQDELETQLLAAPASNWEEAADKVRYLLSVLAATPSGQDPRRKLLIQAVLDDFSRLSREM